MTAVEQVQVEVSPDLCQATVHFKEISYNDFGSVGCLLPHRVSRMFEAARIYAFKNNFLEASACTNKEFTMFVMAAHYTFHPALWTLRPGNIFPYEAHAKLLDAGVTSCTQGLELINKLDKKVLATLHLRYVRVLRATGNPCPFPDRLLSKFKSFVTTPRPLVVKRDVPQIPTSAYRYEVTVVESDIDHNNHTNQSSYIRFCMDGAHSAVRQGKLPKFMPSLWNFPLLHLEVVYIKESWMEDRLLVFIWQQEDNPDAIQCVVKVQRDGQQQAIFHSTMQFGQSVVSTPHL